jgi:hypothetical protein
MIGFYNAPEPIDSSRRITLVRKWAPHLFRSIENGFQECVDPHDKMAFGVQDLYFCSL